VEGSLRSIDRDSSSTDGGNLVSKIIFVARSNVDVASNLGVGLGWIKHAILIIIVVWVVGFRVYTTILVVDDVINSSIVPATIAAIAGCAAVNDVGLREGIEGSVSNSPCGFDGLDGRESPA